MEVLLFISHSLLSVSAVVVVVVLFVFMLILLLLLLVLLMLLCSIVVVSLLLLLCVYIVLCFLPLRVCVPFVVLDVDRCWVVCVVCYGGCVVVRVVVVNYSEVGDDGVIYVVCVHTVVGSVGLLFDVMVVVVTCVVVVFAFFVFMTSMSLRLLLLLLLFQLL